MLPLMEIAQANLLAGVTQSLRMTVTGTKSHFMLDAVSS